MSYLSLSAAALLPPLTPDDEGHPTVQYHIRHRRFMPYPPPYSAYRPVFSTSNGPRSVPQQNRPIKPNPFRNRPRPPYLMYRRIGHPSLVHLYENSLGTETYLPRYARDLELHTTQRTHNNGGEDNQGAKDNVSISTTRGQPRISQPLEAHQPTESKRAASLAAPQPLRRISIENLPVDERVCRICYDDYGVSSAEGIQEQPVQLLGCEHVFGDRCMKRWMRKSKTCPYCRNKLTHKRKHGISGN
ncbi:hypothetical protein V8C42DRAFT_338072 [Trichoderma barbatum]